MYLQYFGLNEAPFSITPDPAFLYLSAEHRDALAHLLYGVGQGGSGGFVQLTGEVGTGKTTLCRCMLEQVPDNTRVALVLNPMLTPRELLATICEELGLETDGVSDSSKAMVDRLNAHLLEQHARGQRVVVVIDEAQNLSPEALEQVRLLTNLETPKEKLLQMVLLGQPELRQLLQRQNLRQLSQRITARYHLAPLNAEETAAYVRHRMMVAGAQRVPFKRSALRALYQRSSGVPRLINIIADRALAGAYAREASGVSPKLVHVAADEVQPSEQRVRSNPWRAALATTAVVLMMAATVLIWKPGLVRGVLSEATPSLVESVSEPLPPEEKTEPANLPAPVLDTPDQELAVGALVQPPVELVEETAQSIQSLEAEWLAGEHVSVWQTVAGLWQSPGRALDIQSACNGLPRTGFACLRDRGSWARIRNLGLPVVLVLQADGARLLALRGFDGVAPLVGAGEHGAMVDRDELESLWFGEYLVAWPQAPDWPAEIRKGEQGPAVEIVMQMAEFAEPPWQGGAVFDQAFEEWLMAFQRRNRLEPDGIIGPNTLIHLMAPTIEQPRLLLAIEEES